MTDRIERELELPASPDEVWQAVTDPAWLALWLADEVTLELTQTGVVVRDNVCRRRLVRRERQLA